MGQWLQKNCMNYVSNWIKNILDYEQSLFNKISMKVIHLLFTTSFFGKNKMLIIAFCKISPDV